MGEPPYKGNPAKSSQSVTGDTPSPLLALGRIGDLLKALGAGGLHGGDLLLGVALGAPDGLLRLNYRSCDGDCIGVGNFDLNGGVGEGETCRIEVKPAIFFTENGGGNCVLTRFRGHRDAGAHGGS